MICSNCGKDIPYSGNVCPWCHADKSEDQQAHTIALLITFVAGGIGYQANGVCGMFAGVIIGVIVGVIAGAIIVAMLKKK